ncbi:MAG TPA: hypothetical protein DEB24_07565 [Coriobacteriia bacterium]|nr:hypothetical protein [Coriobacteriia bacterium]
MGDGIGRITLKTKGNSLTSAVFDFFNHILDRELFDLAGAVILPEGRNFSVGANLHEMKERIERRKYLNDNAVNALQRVLCKIKASPKPFVAAPFRHALGGGMELCLHCHARVTTEELFMGFVELGVGLIPAGGGLKECALRIANAAADDREKVMLALFEALLLQTVSQSAEDARALGFLQRSDLVVDDPTQLPAAAKQHCLALLPGFSPPPPASNIRLGGERDYLRLMSRTETLLKAGRISPYDAIIAEHIACILAGSKTEKAPFLSETGLLILENKHTRELQMQEKTYRRIENFVKTGRMLRN